MSEMAIVLLSFYNDDLLWYYAMASTNYELKTEKFVQKRNNACVHQSCRLS